MPREGLSRELVDWILVRHLKMPGDEPEFYRQLASIPNDLPTLRNYYSQMSLVDDGVGRVLDALQRRRLFENTLVIYTSDHGMSLGEHGFWGHGEDTWPSNMHRQANHIPLIVKPPGNEEGSRIEDALIGTTDIFATIRDYAGLPLPSRRRSSGRSVRPLIERTGIQWKDAVFMEQEETRATPNPPVVAHAPFRTYALRLRGRALRPRVRFRTNAGISRKTRRTEPTLQSCRPGSTPSSPGTRTPGGTSGGAEP